VKRPAEVQVAPLRKKDSSLFRSRATVRVHVRVFKQDVPTCVIYVYYVYIYY